MSLFVLFVCILVVFCCLSSVAVFFEHWGQGSNLGRTRPFFFTRAKSDAVYVCGLSLGHGYLSMAVFIFIYRSSSSSPIELTILSVNKSWRQHLTRYQLYGHLPHITKTIQVRRTRHAGHCWRSRDELISYVLLWDPHIWPGKSRTTSSNIHSAAIWGYGM